MFALSHNSPRPQTGSEILTQFNTDLKYGNSPIENASILKPSVLEMSLPDGILEKLSISNVRNLTQPEMSLIYRNDADWVRRSVPVNVTDSISINISRDISSPTKLSDPFLWKCREIGGSSTSEVRTTQLIESTGDNTHEKRWLTTMPFRAEHGRTIANFMIKMHDESELT